MSVILSPLLSEPIFFVLTKFYWHSNSVTITSFLRDHMNLTNASNFSCGYTVVVKILPQIQFSERSPSGTPQVLVTTLLRVHLTLLNPYISCLKMVYNREMWTVVTFLRNDSVGHYSSGNVITTWSRVSRKFSCI